MKAVITSILLVLICVGSVVAQDALNQMDAAGLKQGHWEKKQSNGKLMYSGDFEDDYPVGEWKRYHQNGVVKALINYPENSDTASVTLFDDYGNKVAEGFYVGQEKAGHWEYFEKGRKVSEENQANGKKNGTAKTYYPTGELFVETTYVDGLEEGVYRAYYKSGELYFECQMKADKRDGFCQIFFSNGEMETDAFYLKGVRQNEWKYFDETGKYSYSLIYDKGVVVNPEVQDSIEQIRYQKLDDNRNKIVDPEQFMSDPVEYMMKEGIH
ncbi:toxin-antitoxin system YwqK family antitoxin [Mangrovibacterium lignilyticum]|uniref:toxin-antitoxin system YwqK family antitoxin n=1 Tax=Mangrovibacterium lignilyticum TaxID=2668052 RepID=UPI0013D4202D|nr:hypothetical protein [Mangrovibacterium lignilyticum]